MNKLTKIALATLFTFSIGATALANETTSTPAKNVILLISDGAGMQTWNAASYYRHGALGREVYDKFDVKLFASTYPLNTSTTPTKTTENSVKFDPAKLWDAQKSDKTYKGSLGSYAGYLQST